MEIYQRAQIIRLEQELVKEGVSLAQLMENAGTVVAEEAKRLLAKKASVAVLCGKGNNGGDGFVAARLLSGQGHSVTVILACGMPQSDIAKAALANMPKTVPALSADKMDQCEAVLAGADLIIDAMFGFGFQGTLAGAPKALIALANAQTCKKLAVDLPSGVECDTAAAFGVAFCANITVTFHALKPACISYPAKGYCSKIAVREVAPSKAMAASRPKVEPSLMHMTTLELVKGWMPFMPLDGNKGSFGKLLLICGSYGMAGACALAAKAAMRSGTGLVTVLLDRSIYPIVSTLVPEAVFWPVDFSDVKQLSTSIGKVLKQCTACVVGCGLGIQSEKIMEIVANECKVPLLVDADGLNAMAAQRSLPTFDCKTVFTPHPGELSKLMQTTVEEIQSNRIGAAQNAAKHFNTVLLLKGAATVVATEKGHVSINSTGNAGMAKGGSGDVLSGIIGAFLAQGMPPYKAAVTGAFIHGYAGDLCARRFSKRAMLPTDLIEMLPKVCKALEP